MNGLVQASILLNWRRMSECGVFFCRRISVSTVFTYYSLLYDLQVRCVGRPNGPGGGRVGRATDLGLDKRPADHQAERTPRWGILDFRVFLYQFLWPPDTVETLVTAYSPEQEFARVHLWKLAPYGGLKCVVHTPKKRSLVGARLM